MKVQHPYRLMMAALGVALFGIVPAAAQSWAEVTPLPEARYDISAVALDGDIYVIGGRNRSGSVLSSVLVFRASEGVWEELTATLDEGRAEAAAVVHEGRIYVIGGLDEDGDVIDDVEVFDPIESEWQDVQEMSDERYGHGATVIDGRIYVVGGENGDQQFPEEVEVYDPVQDRWHVSDSWRMVRPRVAFALVSIGNSAYAFGGFGRLGQIPTPLRHAERFISGNGVDPFLPDQLLGERGRLAAASDGSKAYFLGGVGLRGVSDEVTIFTPGHERASDRWSSGARLLTGRERFAAVIVDEALYAIGGLDSQGRALASVEQLQVTAVATEETEQPGGARLEQNHPNPFATTTRIPFVVEGESAGSVLLEIYDLQGRLVERILDGFAAPGRHEVEWDGNGMDGLPVSSGVYVYVLRQGERRQAKILMRTR